MDPLALAAVVGLVFAGKRLSDNSTAQAEARAIAAQEASRELARGARPAEISRAQAELRAAEADADRAAADLGRLEPLAAKGDVSRASLDAVRASVRVTAGRRDAAREALRLIQDGARPERRQIVAPRLRVLARARVGRLTDVRIDRTGGRDHELGGAAGGVDLQTAARSIVLAAMSNTVVKGGLVLTSGAPGLRKALVPAFLLMLITGVSVAFLV